MDKIKDYRQALKKNGFVLIKNILKNYECSEYVKLLNKHYDENNLKYYKNKTNSNLSDKSFEKVVYNLHNKHPKWMTLFQNKLVLDIISPFLKEGSYLENEEFYLNNISARTPTLGNKGQQIHIDSNLAGVNYMLSVNVMWYFEKSTKKNGATIIVPGTESLKEYCPDGIVPKKLLHIEAEAGDILIFSPNIWHGGGENLDGSSRWALVLGYARWFIKPSFDFFFNTPLHIYNSWNESQRKLLGFHLAPPKTEFTRLRRKSEISEPPYHLQDNFK